MTEQSQKNGIIRFLLENSLFLIGGAFVALVWANTNYETYQHCTHYIHFAVNDVLMAFFFLLAGKEIREAMLPGGALSNVRTASLPLMATLGGMLGPALIFIVGAKMFNPELMRGWAVPMATDIAFSYLVAKMIFGRSVGGKTPAPIVFLLLLAIADDAGGLIVLAVFYPQPASETVMSLASGLGVTVAVVKYIGYAMMALAPVLCLTMWKKLKIHSFWLYLGIAGVISWVGFYLAGIHPALALVPLCWCMPHEHADLGIWAPGESEGQDTLNKMEHWWKSPVELVLGLFGFVNAGVAFSSMGTGTWLVLSGLLVGKPVGIFLCTKAGQLAGLRLPEGMGNKQLLVVGMAAGIGFTVALFVSVVAFPLGTDVGAKYLDSVKMGALLSFSAAILTFMLARALGIKRPKDS